MLKVEKLNASYGDLHVLYDIDLHVDAGEVVSLVGSNGAGKTTLLRVLSGLEPVKSGTIEFQGQDLAKIKAHKRADIGIAHIPQGRGILGTLSVTENLILGTYPKHVRAKLNEYLERSYSMFPILGQRKNQLAGSLSGGEQQMLAIARSLMMDPKLLMLDEPSLGLAPIIVEEVFRLITDVSKQGLSILIVEQNLVQALGIADRAYVLETGHIVRSGYARELADDETIKAAYLGI